METSIQDKPSTEKEEDSFSKDCQSAQRAASQALEGAHESLQILDKQSEQFNTCSQHLQHQQMIVDQSTRMIRGMTWSGWFYNTFLDSRHPPTPLQSTIRPGQQQQYQQQQQQEQQQQYQPNQKYPTNSTDPNTMLQNPNTLKQREIESLSTLSNIQSHTSTLSFQDQHLQILSNQLQELQSISNTLSNTLQIQHTTLESFHQQTDHLIEQEKMVIRRISQHTHPHTHPTSRRRMIDSILPSSYIKVSIQHVSSQRYVSIIVPSRSSSSFTASAYSVVLLKPIDTLSSSSPPPLFYMYYTMNHNSSSSSSSSCYDTLLQIGLLYEKTQTWLGYSKVLGSLTCSSTSWGSREQWEVIPFIFSMFFFLFIRFL